MGFLAAGHGRLVAAEFALTDGQSASSNGTRSLVPLNRPCDLGAVVPGDGRKCRVPRPHGGASIPQTPHRVEGECRDHVVYVA